MTVTSLDSTAISSLAIFGLNAATRSIADSTERLSTGSRFANAGDDIGALASSNRLNAQLVALRQAQTNNLQANSLLQTAFSGASEINDILTTMRARATSANSGTLTATERATLDLEFQELRAEIDSIANSTNFNGIQLLDGSVTDVNDITGITTNATQAQATINFTGAIGAGTGLRIAINGVNFVEGTDFTGAASAADTATNVLAGLQSTNDPDLRALDYSLVGTAITVSARAGGTQGGFFLIDDRPAVSTAAASFDVVGAATNVADLYRLTGGVNDGLIRGGTTVTGTIGDSLVNTQSQTASQITLTIFGNASLEANGEIVLRVDDANNGFIDFTTDAAPTAGSGEFSVGATAEETLQNLIEAIENYTGTDTYNLDQLTFEQQGEQLFIRGATPGQILDIPGGIANITETMDAAEGGTDTFTLNSGTDTGVNVENVVSPGFIGTVSGFTATFNGPDSITASLTVGSDTFTATITDTTPAANTRVAFTSATGGQFTVELAGGQGTTVADQTDADNYAARLNAAFSTLSFSQARVVSSFTGAGQLAGGSAAFTSDDFSDTSIDGITVNDSASAGGLNAVIEFNINGETFQSSGLGSSIGSFETVYLRSTTNGNRLLQITNGGGGRIDLSSAAAATTFEATLRSNFGLDAAGTGTLDFQIGAASDDVLSVGIGSATSDSLFDGATPDLLSQTNAANAITTVDAALDEIGEVIAGIGAAQTRLTSSFNANSSAIIEIDTARGLLADTDITTESTDYAEAIVQQQAAISVLAQTQLLSSNLLTLLENN